MRNRLILAAGMPRAGSGWHYNLVHDLVVAAGGQDARQMRARFHLESILTEVNCNIGALTANRVLPVMASVMLSQPSTIKAHAAPKPLADRLIHWGWIIPTYIYRDPRDALLSAYEYGQRGLQDGRQNAFSFLDSIEKAIKFMLTYVHISETWLARPYVHTVRYEDFLTAYDDEAQRLVMFLNFDSSQPSIRTVIKRYRPENSAGQTGLHFVKGKIGRFRTSLTAEQQQQCLLAFSSYLERTGYPL